MFNAQREADPMRYQFARTASGHMGATMVRPEGQSEYEYECCCRCVRRPPAGMTMERAEPVPTSDAAADAAAAVAVAEPTTRAGK